MDFYKFITIGCDENRDYTISTIKPTYSNVYETAIMLTELGDWNIVEKYNDKEDAIKGHNKYCNMTSEELDNII